MTNLLKFLLKKQRKRFNLAKTNTGFTLIELLVGLVLASLVVTPLMGFMINIVDTESKEEAKATSEQEIQAALDFIAQDLKQAVYIYDADGLNNNSTTDPLTSGIKDQIPPIARQTDGCISTTPVCVPVLVFWKRELRSDALTVAGSSDKDDTFVYSLVAYYLSRQGGNGKMCIATACTRRFQIRNGVTDPIDPNNSEPPSPGFQLFDLTASGISIKQKMNLWRKASADYTVATNVLVDFVDQSTIDLSSNSITKGDLQECPSGTQRTPSTTTLPGGFYACVNSANTLVQVYIRGNALARIEKNTTYTNNKSVYFPTASIQVKGIGLLGIE